MSAFTELGVDQSRHGLHGDDKITRYGWSAVDERGKIEYIDKTRLRVAAEYQRELSSGRATALASRWSWVSCGCIIVGERGGQLWVIDGQHRVAAALRRSDIRELPCLVFRTKTLKEEAAGFVGANIRRKPLSSYERFDALVMSGDESAILVKNVLDAHGIIITKSPKGPMQTASVLYFLSMAEKTQQDLEPVIRICAELCAECPISAKIVKGIHRIHRTFGGPDGIEEKRLRKRLMDIGATRLEAAASRAAAYYNNGGAKIWAEGMMSEVNKNLRDKIKPDWDGMDGEG